MNGYFLIRVGYVFVSWGILFIPIVFATNELQMLATLMLFYLPLGLDYWTHVPKDSEDTKRRYIGVGLPLLLFCMSLILFIINTQYQTEFLLHIFIKVLIWVLSAFFVYLALRDFISYSSEEEDRSNKATRDKQRIKAQKLREDDEERRKYYQGTKTRRFVQNKPKKKGGKKR